MQDGPFGGFERLGSPPIDGIATLNIVDDESDGDHERAAKHHDGDEEPAEAEDAVINDGE